MSTTENQFRGVAFGGFNRQDVLTYVENTVAEHAGQMEELKKELELVQKACREQAAALSEAETRTARLSEQNSRLSAGLEETQRKLAEQSAAFSEAERELAALREKVKKLEPGAEAYARIKDRTASIELEAHARAQTVLDEAEVRAKESRTRVEEWLRKVQAGYERLRTDVDATVSHVSGELCRIQKSLGGITAEFEGNDDALTNILDCCREEEPENSPEPAGRE
jgi:chromosome segregation ATPase